MEEQKPNCLQFKVLNSWKICSQIEIFCQPRRHNINRGFSMISIIMVPGSERMPVLNIKEPNRSTRKLSSSSAISKSIQKNLSPTLCRLWQAEEQGASVVKIWPSQDNDTCPSKQESTSLWSHSISRSSLRRCSHPDSSNALRHPELLLFGDFSSARDNNGNRSSLISTFSYTGWSSSMLIMWNAL